MILSVVSFDGDTTINDGTTFSAAFPPGSPPYQMEATETLRQPRNEDSPVVTGIARSGMRFQLRVVLLGTAHSQLQTLKQRFSTTDRRVNATTGKKLKRLIVKDTADGDKQWYIDVRAESMIDKQAKAGFWVNLYAPDGVWYENVQSTDSESITATGQQWDVDVAGNQETAPIFTLTPTASKTGGFIYRRFCRIYNPNSATAFPNYGIDITDGGLDTAALINDTTVSNQINQGGGIDAVVTTIPIDTAVGGGLPTAGMGYVDTEQISWTGKTTSLTGVTRGIGGTTAAAHLDNAVISRSQMLANGNDVRVFFDNQEIDRWFGTGANAMNAAATKIWISQNWSAKLEGTIESITDVATTLTFQTTKANKLMLSKLPAAGIGLLESEIITWTGKSEAALQLTGLTRGAKFTSAAAHAAAVTFRGIEHDIMLAYGDQTATAPTIDDTLKPMFALTSTNTSWVYSGAFRTGQGKRPGEWRPAVLASKAQQVYRQSLFYTSDYSTAGAPAFADPATEMGMRIASFIDGATYRQENAQVEWRLYHPAGVTDVTATGEKYRTTSSWPATAAFQKSTNGQQWTDVWNEVTPASLTTWTAWTAHSGVSLSGTFNWLRFLFSGAQAAGSGAEADSECDAITVTLPSASVLQVSLGSANSSYDLNGKLTNTETGDYMRVRYQMVVGAALKIDCELKKVTYLADNSDAFSAVAGGFSSERLDWLNLLPGQANTMQWDETGVTGMTAATAWRDRVN